MTSRDRLVEMRLQDHKDGEAMQSQGLRLLAYAGIIFLFGLIGLLIAARLFALTEDQICNAQIWVGVVVALFAAPGLMLISMGTEQDY